MAAKKETYSQAMERLEKIVRQIDNNELDIDILSEKIKEANEIIAFCKDKPVSYTPLYSSAASDVYKRQG